LTVAQALTLDQPGAAHSNSGTITLSGGDLTIRQSGTNPSFTNTGTISIGSGRTCTVSGGSLTQSSPGTVTGAGTLALTNATATFTTPVSVAALALSSSTVSYAPDLSTAATALSLSNSTLTVAGTLTNAAGVTLTITGSTLSGAPFTNQGTLLAQGTSAINGSFTTAAGSVLRVQGALDGGHAALTVLNGFTNNGALELTNAYAAGAFGAALTVTNGTLVNAPGASLSALPGALGGGGRTLTAHLDNRGTLTVAQALIVNAISAAHSNSG